MFISSATLPHWLKVSILADIIFAVMILYNLLYAQTFQINLAILSESLAATAGFLLGFSFALSGMSYFFNFLDSKLHYRKQLGLVGYYFALVYSLTLVFRFPEKYGNGLTSHILDGEVLLGFGAMAILTMMAIISHPQAVHILGATFWRILLRMGYIAFILLIIRAVMIEGEIWQVWFSTMETVPPPRLVLTVFAIAVIVLRIILQIAITFFPKKKIASAVINSNTVVPTTLS